MCKIYHFDTQIQACINGNHGTNEIKPLEYKVLH